MTGGFGLVRYSPGQMTGQGILIAEESSSALCDAWAISGRQSRALLDSYSVLIRLNVAGLLDEWPVHGSPGVSQKFSTPPGVWRFNAARGRPNVRR